MNNDSEKTILRIVQDYCYKRNINNLVAEFALTIAPKIANAVLSNCLTHVKFVDICKAGKDFYSANNLDENKFLINLYRELKQELVYYTFSSVIDSLLEYKKRLENGNLKGFSKGTKEDTLRSNLSIYLQYENFCEPRCGSGNSDIVIPTQKSIIETKLWSGVEYYNSGIPELQEYLNKQQYTNGFYIVYDYNLTPNEIIKKSGEFFQANSNPNIYVIFIRMNPTRPSKIYANDKKKK